MRAKSPSTQSRSKPEQLTFFRRGGKRRGAGRKPKGDRAMVSHARRERITARDPVIVTTRVVPRFTSLRKKELHELVLAGFAAVHSRFGVRFTDWSSQSNHLHLIVECDNERILGQAMKSLFVRLARAWNKRSGRKGRVFLDRYHASLVRNPLQMRNSIVYVTNNARHHRIGHIDHCDPFSSGDFFEVWKERQVARSRSSTRAATLFDPVIESAHIPDRPLWSQPRTWLRRIGWPRHGLIHLHELPRS